MEATKNMKWAGIALIAVAGLIHLFLASEYFGEYGALYGAAFVLNFLGAAVAAVGIYRGERSWGWVLGAVIAAGAFILYVTSMTVGLPGGVREGLEPAGLLSLITEGSFITVFAAVALGRTRSARNSLT